LHNISYQNMFPCVQHDIRMTGVILGTGDANVFEAPEYMCYMNMTCIFSIGC
jgi:hypothetical protein